MLLLYICGLIVVVVVVVYFWPMYICCCCCSCIFLTKALVLYICCCCIFVVVIEVYQDFYNTSHAIWCWKLRYKIVYVYEKSINEIYMLRWMNGNIRKDHTKWRNSFNNRDDSWMKKMKEGIIIAVLFCTSFAVLKNFVLLFCTSFAIL